MHDRFCQIPLFHTGKFLTIVVVCVALLAKWLPATENGTEAKLEVLPSEHRTNGGETLKVLQPLLQRATSSQVALGKSPDATIAAVLVAEDGYVLTKASEAEQFKPWKVYLQDGSENEARLVRRDQTLDLLLLKIEKKGMSAVEWGQQMATQAGQWLCALTDLGGQRGREIRLGVVSAKPRSIEASGVVLGVLVGPSEEGEGVYVEEVAEDSPAQIAGLQSEDVLIAIDDQKLTSNRMLNQMVNSKFAGDTVKIRYMRQGKEAEVEVRLASRSKVMLNWAGEDFANGGTSVRTDNFVRVIQHEIPLSPADMGSVLFDLKGNAIGLNIARVDRVTTFALPAELFVEPLKRWIQEDRVKHSRQPTSSTSELP